MIKRINKLLFPAMLWIIPLAAATWIYGWSINALANTIYAQTTQPFLVNQEGMYIHKNPTIKVSQIEYSVLKVPAAKTTVAKK